jgi:hypothetical protein
MVDEATHRVLWVWTASELLIVLGALGLLVASLVGTATVFSFLSRPVRVAAVLFLLVELSIPLWVYVDIRHREPAPDGFWVHVAAMPGINLFGLVAYLQERRRNR